MIQYVQQLPQASIILVRTLVGFLFLGGIHMGKREDKPFISIDEQINLLKNRGLNVPDSQLDEVRSFLLNNNYYRISGYTLTA